MRERSNSNEAPPRPVARRRPGRKPNGPQGCIGLKARLADDRSARPNDLEITYVSIEAIRAYKNHARVHDKKALSKAKALLSAHGQIVPVVIDETGVILDGVLQHRALLEMGHDQVRVIIVRNRVPARPEPSAPGCKMGRTPLFAKNQTHPEFLSVKIGRLDDPGFFRLGQHAHVRERKHPETAGAERWGCCECPVCELYLAHGRPAYQDDRVLWSDSLLSWQTSSSPDKLGG